MSVSREDLEELHVRLEVLIELLDAAGETYWATWMRRALVRLENGELLGLSQVLAAYGSEDGFGTLTLHDQGDDGALRLRENRRLDHLRTTVFELANRITSSMAMRPPDPESSDDRD